LSYADVEQASTVNTQDDADDEVVLTGSNCQMWSGNTSFITGGPGKTNFISGENTALAGLGAYTGIDEPEFTKVALADSYRVNSTTAAHAKSC